MEHVSFKNRDHDLAADLHLPPNFDRAKKYSAIVLATPGSSVKEQIGANYARRLAERGYVAITFDPSYQGASGGEPRDLEDPYVRAEDIRCAIDYLVTLKFVDESRIGLLGICAGGGCAIHAALTERRFKAIGTVVGGNIGAAFRRFMPGEEVFKTLDAVAQARTAEARGEAARRDPWIPDSLHEAKEKGITDAELLEAVQFYRESKYKNPNSTNRILFKSFGLILGFDAFNLVPQLLTQPLCVVVGGKQGATGQYEDGERLFNASPSKQKEFYVVEGASHYDMYWKAEFIDEALDRLQAFYCTQLA